MTVACPPQKCCCRGEIQCSFASTPPEAALLGKQSWGGIYRDVPCKRPPLLVPVQRLDVADPLQGRELLLKPWARQERVPSFLSRLIRTTGVLTLRMSRPDTLLNWYSKARRKNFVTLTLKT